MTLCVLDASITSAWLLEDEHDPFAIAVQESALRDGAVTPEHWRVEVANSLLSAERQGRLRPGRALFHLERLLSVQFETDKTPRFAKCLDLAVVHRLTFYDAVYLELALRRHLPLATVDRALARAAQTEGVAFTAA